MIIANETKLRNPMLVTGITLASFNCNGTRGRVLFPGRKKCALKALSEPPEEFDKNAAVGILDHSVNVAGRRILNN
jgi:hypothetical protein